MKRKPVRQHVSTSELSLYENCVFCHRTLTSNQTLERFPHGSRLGFDANRGRLWVICSSCRQWNLVPLELRWEVIEACERLFHTSARVVSTDNIALAQVGLDLELVAVGQPTRHEFAAWRYGTKLTSRWEQHRRRVRSSTIASGAMALAVAAAAVPGLGLGVGAAAGLMAGAMMRELRAKVYGGRHVASVPVADDYWLRIQARNLRWARIEPSWSQKNWSMKILGDGDAYSVDELHQVSADFGIPTLGLLMPTINRSGGRPETVEAAVRLVEQDANPARLIYSATKGLGHGKAHAVGGMPAPIRLAIEMVAHEEVERQATLGFLQTLERAWLEAEELAAITDSLLEPSFVQEALDRMRVLSNKR